MRKSLLLALVTGALALGPNVPRGAAAPPVSDPGARWEHAELMDSVFGRARWTTAKDEIWADTMKDLADRLKAPAGKEDASGIHHRLRVLDKLSADGWEVVESPTLNTKDPPGRVLRLVVPPPPPLTRPPAGGRTGHPAPHLRLPAGIA